MKHESAQPIYEKDETQIFAALTKYVLKNLDPNNRPEVTKEDIDRCINSLQEYTCVGTRGAKNILNGIDSDKEIWDLFDWYHNRYLIAKRDNLPNFPYMRDKVLPQKLATIVNKYQGALNIMIMWSPIMKKIAEITNPHDPQE